MSKVFAKLNLKDQPEILVINAPESFEPELKSVNAQIVRDIKKAKAVAFSLAFVTTPGEIEKLAPALGKKAAGDAVVWLAYPKASSKKYTCEIKRGDGSWKALGAQGFEPVRMVAIDEDWSAVRFRRVEFIKNMTRPEQYRLTAKR